MKLKTSELTGRALDFAVIKCGGLPGDTVSDKAKRAGIVWINNGRTDRAGKPFKWMATKNFSDTINRYYGPTILIAVMRCFVADKLGDTVEIPEDIKP